MMTDAQKEKPVTDDINVEQPIIAELVICTVMLHTRTEIGYSLLAYGFCFIIFQLSSVASLL